MKELFRWNEKHFLKLFKGYNLVKKWRTADTSFNKETQILKIVTVSMLWMIFDIFYKNSINFKKFIRDIVNSLS